MSETMPWRRSSATQRSHATGSGASMCAAHARVRGQTPGGPEPHVAMSIVSVFTACYGSDRCLIGGAWIRFWGIGID